MVAVAACLERSREVGRLGQRRASAVLAPLVRP